MSKQTDQLRKPQGDIEKLQSAARVMACARRKVKWREGESQEDYATRMRPHLKHVDNLLFAALAKHDEYMREAANRHLD